MKITFIKHSCYFVELEEHCLLFDWFEGDVPETNKPLYAFASHSHGDHFSPKLFDLRREGGKTAFILSNDIFRSRVPKEAEEETLFVSPHQTYEIGEMKIATLESTDAGVAFLIQCEGKLFYHAGDLNCWVWDGAPRFQNDMMRARYRKELELLSGKEIDVAFVPLDPRQEADFDLGMKYLFETVTPAHVFPMHMWDDYSVVPLFKGDPTCKKYAPFVMDVTGPGQVFLL